MSRADPVSIRRILRLHPRRTASVTALLALAGAAEGFGLVTLLPILDSVAGSGSPTAASQRIGHALQRIGVTPSVTAFILLVAGALFLKAGFRWMAMAQVGSAVASVAAELRMRLIRALLDARFSHFAGQAAGRAASALSRDAFWAAFAYRDACAALAAALQLVVYAATVLLLSWKLGLLAVGVGLAVSAPLGLWVRVSRRAGARQTRHAEALVTRFVDLLNVIKPVKAMARERTFLEGLAGETEALRRAEADHVRASEALRSLQEPLLAVVVLGLLLLAFTRGGAELPTVLVLALLFQRIVGRFHVAQTEYQAMAAAASAYSSLESQIEEAERSAERLGGSLPAPPLAEGIELRGVAFAHGERTVLRGASLEVPAGAFVAIMGASGAGKSTLLDLIAGLREPDAGSVLVDGVPLGRIDRRAWRARIGYVPQESVLLHDTIVANVLLGAEWVGAEAAARAVERAGAGEMMAARGEGVGERGLRLSGGERRRLALARALVTGPRLLLLDEPTSELDPVSSTAIADTLRALSGSMTIIAVTHDPRLAAAADAVYRLEGGRLALLPDQSPPAESHLTASASSSGAIQWPMS